MYIPLSQKKTEEPVVKFDEWGEILLKRGFGYNGAGTASSEARKANPTAKYFCISGAGGLLEVFLPDKYLRIHAGSSPGQFRVLKYSVTNPTAPKNAFYGRSHLLNKECPAGEITKMFKNI